VVLLTAVAAPGQVAGAVPEVAVPEDVPEPVTLPELPEAVTVPLVDVPEPPELVPEAVPLVAVPELVPDVTVPLVDVPEDEPVVGAWVPLGAVAPETLAPVPADVPVEALLPEEVPEEVPDVVTGFWVPLLDEQPSWRPITPRAANGATRRHGLAELEKRGEE
jgi:hypothetical protein